MIRMDNKEIWTGLLKKLIRTGVGRTRFSMAIIGLSVALLLLLTAVQVQVNYNNLLHSKNNRDSIANFLVVNKTLNDQNLGNAVITPSEISELKQQPFVESVGLLTPSQFKASIQSASDRFPFYTDIAFESVPDEFIDVTSKDWKWDSGAAFIPIIAPNLFLDFYNFQFSFSQNLPQLTPEVVKMILFKVNVYSSEGMRTFNGRVVGLSDRISSLLVPQGFMDWANKSSGKAVEARPSRVIIRTTDAGHPAMAPYLKSKGLSTDTDKMRFSKYRQVVDLVVRISGVTGVILLLFAMLVFTLFIQLTIASCKEEITLLITLGASPGQLRRFLMKQFFPVNIFMITASLVLVAMLQYWAHTGLAKQNIFLPAMLSLCTFFAAIALLLLIWYVNRVTIHKYVDFQ